MTEATEQKSVKKWADMMSYRFPCLKMMYHTPNGGFRNIAEAAHFKQLGVKAGVPDLCLPYPSQGFHGLYIEMKTDKGKPTGFQREYIEWLNGNGYKAVICHSAEEAIRILWSYLTEKEVPEYDNLQSENREQGVYHDSRRT